MKDIIQNVQLVEKKKKLLFPIQERMKRVPINMYYCLFQFHLLKFFLGFSQHGGFLPNFNFFNANQHALQRNR